jgi:hypothetical protein
VTQFEQTWSNHCPYCSATLLSKEQVGWCCSNGKKRLPQLPAYPVAFQHYLNTRPQLISPISRRLNNLFAFSAIGTTQGFVNFHSLANVVLTGRVYHCLIDLSEGEHSMHWFLYDETAQDQHTTQQDIPSDFVQQVRALLESVNPYISEIRHILSEVEVESSPLAVELQHRPAGGELAAVINNHNLSIVNPRKIVFFQHGRHEPQFVHILSRHYEPLQYPLLFLHGTPGWGRSSSIEADQDHNKSDILGDASCSYTQIQ